MRSPIAPATPVRAAIVSLPDNALSRTSCYVDDSAQGSHTFGDLLKGWRDFLHLCRERTWSLNATKTKAGYDTCTFFGFEADANGTRLADKNLDPITRMVPPQDLSELRHTLGVFVQSKAFIPDYALIVACLTALTRSTNGKPVPFIWNSTTQAAYDHIRNLLLDGVHLHPAHYDLPFHGAGDASDDGKAFGIFQYNDLPPGTSFEVLSHSSSHTTVQVLGESSTHDIPHSLETRKPIAWFSKTWSEADRKRAPYYLEADALLWGLQKCRFWALSSPYTMYAHTDHLPLRWIRQSDKGPVSNKLIEDLSDMDYTIAYIPGPENFFDPLSRYPLLGPRVLAPSGLAHVVDQLLAHLPDSLKDSARTHVYAPPHTIDVARRVQAWRNPTNPIIKESITHTRPPNPANLIITVPRAEDAPRTCARLFHSDMPSACLLPFDLAPLIADADQAMLTGSGHLRNKRPLVVSGHF